MNEISWFETYDKIYKLKTSIPLTLTQDDLDFYAENKTYNILAVGFTEKQAIVLAREIVGRLYEWKFENVLPIPQGMPEWIKMIDDLIEK